MQMGEQALLASSLKFTITGKVLDVFMVMVPSSILKFITIIIVQSTNFNIFVFCTSTRVQFSSQFSCNTESDQCRLYLKQESLRQYYTLRLALQKFGKSLQTDFHLSLLFLVECRTSNRHMMVDEKVQFEVQLK